MAHGDIVRKAIAPDTQAEVLLKSRRRCCICFGLNRDTLIKQGQIAHLDRDPSNNAEDNLAFLCLDHHDQYDSRSSQSKGLTALEVLKFRAELHAAIRKAFSEEVFFGRAHTEAGASIAGHYIRTGANQSAELKIRHLGGATYHVSGLALWGTDRRHGPNLGELEFVADLAEDTMMYTGHTPGTRPYKATIVFSRGRLTVTEENFIGKFGLNASFGGEYEIAN